MTDEELTLDTEEGRKLVAQRAATNKKFLARAIKGLEGASRRSRQQCASVIAMAAEIDPERLLAEEEIILDMVDSMDAGVRAQGIKAVTALSTVGFEADKDTKEAIEDALYDEDHGMVRGAAFAWFCQQGKQSPEASDQVWSFINEAVQCCHGNEEFDEMLIDLLAFAQGNISDETAASLVELLDFDAKNGIGTLKRRCEEIIEACESR